jgi:undecaprenyl diphosphate synthase
VTVQVPRHVAIIMDGNGRWARQRALPRVAGHRAGLGAVRITVEECLRRGIGVLTLFAFSSENWARPPQEVGMLMELFLEALDREVDELAAQGVAVSFIGERTTLAAALQQRIADVEARTQSNTRLRLVIAVAYGGRGDIVAAARRLAAECRAGRLEPAAIDEARFGREVALAGLPEPDLFIRTGGEQRISNFLLWNLAYTELWFTDTYWPAFDAAEFERACLAFAARERRYGKTSQQVQAPAC